MVDTRKIHDRFGRTFKQKFITEEQNEKKKTFFCFISVFYSMVCDRIQYTTKINDGGREKTTRFAIGTRQGYVIYL